MRSRTKAIARLKLRWKIFAMRTAFGIAASIFLTFWAIAPTQAKSPISGLQSFPFSGLESISVPGWDNLLNPNQSSSEANNQPITTWITLDGRRLFQIAATSRDGLSDRVEDIEPRLQTISQDYFRSNSWDLEVKSQRGTLVDKDGTVSKANPDIYINGQRLLTITDQDAQVQGDNDPQKTARKLIQSLEQDLRQAKQERQSPYLLRQGAVAVGVFLGVIICSWSVRRWHRRLQSRTAISAATKSPTDSVTTQLTQQQNQNLQEARRRLFQATQALIWGGGTLISLSLFPYTRIIPFWILSIFTIPVFKVPTLFGIVALGTYVSIRLSYVLIDRFTTVLANNSLLGVQDSYVRLQLRVITISTVTKSIATFSGIGIGTLLALSTLGVNLAPLLAGAGLIGVGISLAAQSLIKDAINGFLIIMEDQYAVGDVINVGDVGGLVENLNLRITQVRDGEGRLITIPNSEIKTVANLSSRWSRVDLMIPIAYDTNIDRAMNLIDNVGLEMDEDPKWREPILERPQVLGVDNFGDRGLMIRVWIKTQPLKQWEVAREFRRRLKIAFDRAGVAIPVPQQAIWVNTPDSMKLLYDDKDSKDAAFVRK